jgi:VWFA-related protein
VTGRRTLLAAALACATLLTAGAAAAALVVEILSPSAREHVFGVVEVTAEVRSDEPVPRVELFLDDRLIGVRMAPPYAWTIDVGEDNRDRRFSVVAHGASGATASDTVITKSIVIDDAIDLNLKQLYVTVTRGGERALDLERADFQVIDGGDRRELVTFERGDVPLTAVLMVDASASMRGRPLAAALDGARSFMRQMKPLDEAMLLLFSDRVLLATPFTGREDALAAGVGEVEAAGETALNDHLYLALKLLDRRQGRRVVVLLTDGADVVSALGMDEVLWKERRGNALVYWLRLEGGGMAGAEFSSSWRGYEGNARQLRLFEELVEESGGRIETVGSLDEVEGAFAGILQELREQYVLGYYPLGLKGDGSWRRVEVKVAAPGVRVRAREGYVDQ